MRCMRINKQKFHYALYAGREQIIDEYGNVTGEYEVLFEEPMDCEANISGAKGEAEIRQFGENLEYDKVVVMDLQSFLKTHIDEYSRLWIDTELEFDNEGKVITPHDYDIKRIAKSLHTVSMAVKKVVVSG